MKIKLARNPGKPWLADFPWDPRGMLDQKKKGFLKFGKFPFFPGDEMNCGYASMQNLGYLRAYSLTLMCIQEKLEETQDSENLQLHCYKLYSETKEILVEGDLDIFNNLVPVNFTIPEGGHRATILSAYPPIYWDLEVKAEFVKGEYTSHFLIPVYLEKYTKPELVFAR